MLEFGLGCGFMLVVCGLTVFMLLKLGLLNNPGDVTHRFEAHRELVTGSLDLISERNEGRLSAFQQIVEGRIKAEMESVHKDLEDARAGILGLHGRLEKTEQHIDQLATTGGIAGEGQHVPRDMEVVGGGAIGND